MRPYSSNHSGSSRNARNGGRPSGRRPHRASQPHAPGVPSHGAQLNGSRGQAPGSHASNHRPASAAFSAGGNPEQIFLAGTAIDPSPRIRLEDGSAELTMRAMDLISPIGRGQRGLIVAPPGSGKTTFLKHLCQAVAKAAPDIKLFCLLVDERPEEVTDFKRSVSAQVFSSSTDQSYDNHIRTADTLMREAFREAAAGADVMVLIDSLTRLSRVHNAESRSSGRTLSGGVDARALEVPRRIFGSARKIENGGSITILATILVDTGSRMDQIVFEEFKGTGNMEIYLSREISNHRIFPAVDIGKSGTRRAETMVDRAELDQTGALRRVLMSLSPVEAAKALVDALSKFKTNADLLDAASKMEA